MIRERIRSLLTAYRSRLQHRDEWHERSDEECIRTFLRMPEEMP